MSDLESLRNIGPRSAARLKAVGIVDAEVFGRIGAVEAHRMVKNHQTSLNLLYTLHGGLLGIPWQDILE